MSLKTIITSVKNWLDGVKDEAEADLQTANKFVNAILAEAATPTGQTVEAIIETILPAELVNAAKLWLPKIFTDLKWVTAEAGKTDTQILAEGAAYLASTTGPIKAVQANSLVSLVSEFQSSTHGTGLTIQQALTAAQPVHAPLVIAA